MDYKETLNLPRTDFPMKADLVTREPARLARWQQEGLYESVQAARSGSRSFVLHDGPPFANGDVHIGTALNKILKDILVKYKTMRGYRAPYVPGWDCHGLPIEFKVTQELRKQAGSGAVEADAVKIRQACEAYARKYIEVQRGQFQRLGVLGDWGRPYLTLDREYEAEELRLFADLVEQGFVYRGKKPVYWSIPCRTALAEAEVEYQDHVSPSVYVKFPVADQPGVSVLIWTTTPWTLPANLAIAYNSTFSYSVVRVGGELIIVSALLLSTVAEKCGWSGYEIVRSLHSDQLGQIEVQHPFCARRGKLVAGDAFVESTTGTGFVHVAPGHGLEDYGLGLEQGLPIYSPVDDDGKLAYTGDLPVEQQMPAGLIGKSILERQGQSEANLAVLELLRAGGHLAHQEKYSHSYPHCWRSKTPVIFRAMDQWFIEIDHVRRSAAGGAGDRLARPFREEALAEIDRVSWIPDWGKNRIEAAVKGRPDWCISRQRTWGVPIPAFYDGAGRPMLDARVVRRVADLIEREGSNAWFERPTEVLWAEVKPQDWTGADPVGKSSDTLDVWIDSGSSSRCVLMRRAELRRDGEGPDSLPPGQVDMYLEGSDQHRGWFQSSLLLGLAGNGTAPYRTVLTHGFMVDADREKISKSKQGQYDKPQTADSYVKRYGADVLRLWVASQDFRNDIIVSEERIAKVGESYRVIRNALRYQLSNLYDFDPDRDRVSDGELTGLDRWILGEFAVLETEVLCAYDRHEFHVVYQKLSQFAAVQLSAIYHDVVKDRLYTDPAQSRRRRSTQTALHRLVRGLCQMLAPVLAFTADEAWEFVPGRREASVHASVWEPGSFQPTDAERQLWAKLFLEREQALAELEKARQNKLIGKALEAKVVRVSSPELQAQLVRASDDLRELLNVSQLEWQSGAEPAFRIERANGQKCDRCWHWETDLGSDPAHPGLCGRCARAVKG
ncbi:MAG: isoleucine--tRNA ligase [Verrucomicrobia bacterium]|nr:isoleucine--tRNA ligase [Verrucomicrobiota bacterium]